MSTTKIYWMNAAIYSFNDPIYIKFVCVKFHGEGGWCNCFKYFENQKSYVNEFLHCQYSKVSESYFGR